MKTATKEKLTQIRNAQKKLTEVALRIVDTDPWVIMKLGGHAYKYELSFGAVQELFRATGVVLNLQRLEMDDIKHPDMFGPIMLAGLRTHNEDVFAEGEQGQKKILRMVSMRHLNYYATVIMQAIQATEPDPDELAEVVEEMQNATAEVLELDPLAQGSTSDSSGLGVVLTDSPFAKSNE